MLTASQRIAETRRIKAGIAASRIAYLESLAKPTKRDREQLAAEREILARCADHSVRV
jgi:hypothetical protein